MKDWRELDRAARNRKKETCRDLTGYDCDYEPKSARDFENHLLDEHPEGNKKR